MRGGKNIFKSSPIEFYIIGPWKRISNFQPLQPLQRALLNLSVGIPGIKLILRGQEKPERQNKGDLTDGNYAIVARYPTSQRLL